MYLQWRAVLLGVVIVWIRTLGQESEAGLQVGRPDAGVELPAQVGFRHHRLVLGRLVHETQLVVLGRDEVTLDRVQRVGGLAGKTKKTKE